MGSSFEFMMFLPHLPRNNQFLFSLYRVNCSFYFKIGACRHGDRCSRLHNKPTFSQVCVLLGFLFFILFFSQIIHSSCVSGVTNVPTTLSKSNLPSGFILHLLQRVMDLPQWDVFLFLTLEELLKIWLGVG